MGFEDRKKHLKEKHAKIRCYKCKKSVKDCDPKCDCVYCIFHDKFDSIGGDYQYIKNWMKRNLKLYDKLFSKGLVEQAVYVRKWKKRQLLTIEDSGTKIFEWTAYFDINDGKKIDYSPPVGYQEITPYYDRKKKDLKLRYCQICGTDIEYRYYIVHEEKKLYVRIGSECATAFYFGDILVKKIKKHMKEIIEKEFNKLENYLKKSISERIESHPPNEKELARDLERIYRHFSKGRGQSSITPQNIAKLLLDLDKDGFKVFENHEVENQNREVIEERKIKLILETIMKLAGVYKYAVRHDHVLQQLENLGMTKQESNFHIQYLLQKKSIFKFTTKYYKITE